MTKHVLAFLLAWCCIGVAQAQENFPPQSYRPDELVSFNASLPLNTALEILNSYSQRFENRIIVDSKVRTKAIGVSVENMQWKRALEYVLRSNTLQYSTHDRYYQIEDLGKQVEPPPPPKSEYDFDTPEVEINAIFFQADYQTLREIGIDWSTFNNGTVQVQGFGATNVTNDFLRASASGTINRTINVSALLRAFESTSRGEVIARPTIRVVDGGKGKIKVGTNFYLTTVDFAGNLRFSEYESGIILTVTPTVIGRNDSTFIYLNLIAERSDVQLAANNTTKNITEGTTRVLLLDGEQTAIAGLISNDNQNVRRGVPFLKDLPWWFFGLRYLFGYESVSIKKRELIVLIAAKLVTPLGNRRNVRMDLQDYIDAQKREFNKVQSRGYQEGRTREAPARRPRTSQRNR